MRTWLAVLEIERIYQEKGYCFANVRLLEGGNTGDTKIVIEIFEGPKMGSNPFAGVVTSVENNEAHSDQHSNANSPALRQVPGTAVVEIPPTPEPVTAPGKVATLPPETTGPTGPVDDIPVPNSPQRQGAGKASNSRPAPTLTLSPASQRATFLFPRSERRIILRRLAIALDGVETWNCRGGINIVAKTLKFGTIDIEAEEAFIRRGPERKEFKSVMGRNGETWVDPDEQPMNVSVKGDVILRQLPDSNPGKGEQRIFRATELDYDFVTDRLEARNAELEVVAPGLLTPIKIKSPKIEQFHPLVGQPNGLLSPAQHREIRAGMVWQSSEPKSSSTKTPDPKVFDLESGGFW